jgi:hypothetical protein
VSQELIHVQNGQASPSDAVIQVAHVLNPLGSVASIVATLGACAVEIGNFKSEANELRVRHAVASDIIRTRQIGIVALFESRAHDSEAIHISTERLWWGLQELIGHACNMDLPVNQVETLHGTIRILSNKIGDVASNRGSDLVQLSSSLQLDDTRAAVAAWRVLER